MTCARCGAPSPGLRPWAFAIPPLIVLVALALRRLAPERVPRVALIAGITVAFAAFGVWLASKWLAVTAKNCARCGNPRG